MDIACPTCATTYEIDDASVGEAGRKVRCAECSTLWRAWRNRPSEVLSAPAPKVVLLEDPPPLAPSEADIATLPDLPVTFAEEPPEEVVAIEAEAAPETSGVETPAFDAPPPPKPGKAKIIGKPKMPGVGIGKRLKALASLPMLVLLGVAAMFGSGYAARDKVVRVLPHSAAVFYAVGKPVNLRGIDIRDVRSRLVDDSGVNILVIDGNLVNVAADRVPVPRLRFAVIGDKGQELYVWSAQADKPQLQPGETLAFRRRLAAPPNEGKDVTVRFLGASDITAGLK
jgi:predicted Zn finger-like uncharacterized protein